MPDSGTITVRGGILTVVEDLEGRRQCHGGHALGLAAHDHLGQTHVIGGVQHGQLQQIEGNLIYPHVVGESVGLPSIWVLAAVTIGGNLMGIVGMLVFIPLLSVFYTIFREFVYLRLKKKHIKQVTKTEIEEYTEEEIVNSDISEGK